MPNLKPKKHLGQHFLKDATYARRIVALLPAGPDLPVVEIGPGEGVLTALMVAAGRSLTAIEVDPDALAHLAERFTPEQLRLIDSDVLKWNPAADLSGPAHMIGNLPYNISSPIFFHLLPHRDLVASGVFMLQKEVAERICAAPGSKTFGILSVLLGAYFEREYAFTVPPGAFRPPPKVQSGVIRLLPKADPPTVDFQALRRVVKQAFGQRRKTLRNALRGLTFTGLAAEDPLWGQRAEQLSIPAFVDLAARLEPKK